MLSEKLTLLNELDKQILTVPKVEEIEKEIDETETFKMRIMDTTDYILTRTTPPVIKLVPSEITTPPAQVHMHVASPEHPPASSAFTNQGIQPFANPFSSHQSSGFSLAINDKFTCIKVVLFCFPHIKNMTSKH